MPVSFTNLQIALRSLSEQRTRALLSALGIAVGSLAIVLLISIAKGVQFDISKQVEQLGVNLIVVIPGQIGENSMFSPNLAGVSYLKDEDLARVRAVPGVRTAAPLMFVGGGIRNGKLESPTTFIIAAGPEWFTVHPVTMAEGRPFSASDAQQPVAVIGSVAKKLLFGDAMAAVGKTVDINGTRYRIVGVTKDKTSENSLFSMGSFENMAYIPYPYAKTVVPNPELHRIMIQTRPEVDPKSLVASIKRVMAERIDRREFSVLTQEDLLGLIFKVMGILTWLLTGLTSIALFVGGVGIMTVMLMSVNERAREIGIRKTVGARRSDIFAHFLSEAVALGVLGGATGLVVSAGVCAALSQWTPIKPLITLSTVLLSFGTSVGIGAIFGVWPAMNAARKDPVVALRSGD